MKQAHRGPPIPRFGSGRRYWWDLDSGKIVAQEAAETLLRIRKAGGRIPTYQVGTLAGKLLLAQGRVRYVNRGMEFADFS